MQSANISANISFETFKLMEHYVHQKGIQTSILLENAILHYLQAIDYLPEDIIIPPKIIVSKTCGENLLKCIENPSKPTKAMKALFKVEEKKS
ncbi:Ribbon-helix-helix protein CopG domain-containing protein [Candidatus Magnetomoraceae bacterium gMMP-15]